MIFPSAENFLKIFRFYKNNSTTDIKELSKSAYKYSSIDKYYEALNFVYPDDAKGLTYAEDKDILPLTVNSRNDLANYFNYVLNPGSHSFNTPDNYMFKKFILDWASVIKSFQDSLTDCYDVYSLSSDDIDKAIKGFGIDFINSRTVKSLSRRQTFLLNMCELYKIKGSPNSIIKALNIIGIQNIYIMEAWIYPTRDGKKDIEIKWIPVQEPQKLDTEKDSYTKLENISPEYWKWGRFNSKLTEIGECHWFYKKQEIIDINWDDPETYFHLPSITPYFNIKIKFDRNDTETLLAKMQYRATEDLNNYLHGKEPNKCIYIESEKLNIDFISCYCGLVYSIIQYGDLLRYLELKKFIEKYGIEDIDYSGFEPKNRYIQLIYEIFTRINSVKNQEYKTVYKNILSNFEPSRVSNGYCSYEEIKHWWISTKHKEHDDLNGLTSIKQYIKPSLCRIISDNKNFVEFFWNDDYNYGYYDLEIYIDEINQWVVSEQNCEIGCKSMQRILQLKYDKYQIQYQTVEDLYNKIRIVHYHTEKNIPSIFFGKPFYFNMNETDTTMDMLYSFNNNLIETSLYSIDPLYNLFLPQNNNTIGSVTDSEILENKRESIYNLDVRNTDRDTQYRTFMNCFLQYPNSITIKDKEFIYRNSFFEYFHQSQIDYKNVVEHDASELRYYNYKDKYPLNKKWNWGISYGKSKDETFFFVNYESDKWCRIKSGSLLIDDEISLDDTIFNNEFGTPIFKDGKVYIKVCKNDSQNGTGSYFVIDNNCIYEDQWNCLKYYDKTYDYSENLENDLKNEYKCDYTIVDGKIHVFMHPSDMFPSSVIQEHIYDDKKYLLSDTLFKKDSKLCRNVVVSKIDLAICEKLYDNIADTFNEEKKDIDRNNDIKNSVVISVYVDPYGKNPQTVNYNYQNFLKYLYKNSLIVDINTGYIYKKLNYYLDENNYLYIKCYDYDQNRIGVYSDPVIYRWIRVKVSREWNDNESRRSIYYKLDNNFNYVLDNGGNRIPCVNCGDAIFGLEFRNKYDSERYLRDPVIKSGSPFTTETVNTENVLSIKNGKFSCLVRRDIVEDGEIKNKYVSEKNIETYLNTESLPYRCLDPLVDYVRFGLSQELLDWINTNYIKNAILDYENMILAMCDALNEYVENVWHIKTRLDIYHAHIFHSDIVRQIVKFYKPKRDRMLSLVSEIDISDHNDLIMTVDDLNYNSVYLNNYRNRLKPYNTRENGLHNRTRIRQEIHEYIPFNDLVFIDKNNIDTNVNSFIEVYPYENSQIPSMTVFDRYDDFTNHELMNEDKKIYSDLYVTGFTNEINGFYFTYSKDYICKKNYVFKKCLFNFISDYDEDGNKMDSPRMVSLERWFVYKRINENLAGYKCEFVSQSNITDNPYLNSDGDYIKYCKVSGMFNNYQDLQFYLFNANYPYGDFQLSKEGNTTVQINRRKIDPVFYFKDFPNQKYNGFYYVSDKYSRNGNPVYYNKYGKMISLYDLNDVDNTYLDFAIGEYNITDNKKYWIITDYCQIPDISDATYIAYCDTEDSIFENSQSVNYGLTKSFYKLRPDSDNYNSDRLFVCGCRGYSIQEIEEHPELVKKFYTKYDCREEYSKILQRRISQNRIPVKFEPDSYIDFNFSRGLCDYFGKVQTSFTDQNNQQIKLFRNKYGCDIGNNDLGSLILCQTDKLEFKCLDNFTPNLVVMKLRSNIPNEMFGDTLWHTVYIKKINVNVCDLYVDCIKKKQINCNIRNVCIEKFSGYVCEYAAFTNNIPEWYYKVIMDYDVFRFRHEGSKKEGISGTNNYNPIFTTQMPRTVYGRFCTGLPENVEGDRVTSTKIVNGKLVASHYDGENILNGYKWNVDGFYYPDDPKEVSNLWTNRTSTRIYDRKVYPEYRNGIVTSVRVERNYHEPVLKVGENSINHPERLSKYFLDGTEFCVPSNYKAGDQIPCWWVKKPNGYKTGSVQHRPLYVAIRQYTDEYYPHVDHVQSCTQYFDYKMMFDGQSNGNYDTITSYDVDTNTSHAVNLNKFVEYRDDAWFIKGTDKNIGNLNNQFTSTSYNDGDTFCCPCNSLGISKFFEPNNTQITQKMKDNLIFHKSLKITFKKIKNESVYGVFTFKDTVPFRKQDEYEYCYSKTIEEDIFSSYLDSKLNNSIMTTDKLDVKLYTEFVLVPAYRIESGYYTWELRQYKVYVTSDPVKFESKNKSIVLKRESNVRYNDTNKYTLYITEKKLLQSYVDCLRLVDTDLNKEFINQYHNDICNMKLCEYDQELYQKLIKPGRKNITQKIIDNYYFRNYDCICFIDNEIKISSLNRFNYQGNYYLFENELYVKCNHLWYGPFKINENDIIPEQLKNSFYCMNCNPIDVVYTMNKCYVMVQEGEWVSVQFRTGFDPSNNSINLPYRHIENRKIRICVNVTYTDPENTDWFYCMDTENIQNTILRYKKFNNLGTDQFNHFGEDWKKDANDNKFIGNGKCDTIKDRVSIYPFYICVIDIKDIKICPK